MQRGVKKKDCLGEHLQRSIGYNMLFLKTLSKQIDSGDFKQPEELLYHGLWNFLRVTCGDALAFELKRIRENG